MNVSTVEVQFPAGRRLRVLEHRSRIHDFAAWERCYIEALVALLRPGDVVYDVGAEEGEFAALAATIVGGENVHLFEPTPTVWPNIRAVWEANGLDAPGGSWQGFAGAELRGGRLVRTWPNWPACATGPLQPDGRFSVVTERPDIDCITLDVYAEVCGIPPSVVLVDVEGAEVLVVEGARETLRTARPLVFVSVHPADWLARFPAPERIARQRPGSAWHLPLGCEQEHLFRAFAEAGYAARWLGTDHEAHWLFYPEEQRDRVVAALGRRA